MASSGSIHMPRSTAAAELPAPTGDVPDHPWHGSEQRPKRDVLGLWAGEHGDGEGAKFWLRVLTEIRNRGTGEGAIDKGSARRLVGLAKWEGRAV